MRKIKDFIATKKKIDVFRISNVERMVFSMNPVLDSLVGRDTSARGGEALRLEGFSVVSNFTVSPSIR